MFSDKLGEEETLVLDNNERTRRNLELLERCKKLTNKLTTSMARSDLGLTTWSKLKKQTSQSPLRRYTKFITYSYFLLFLSFY